MEVVEGAYHFLHVEKPPAVNDRILAWVSACAPTHAAARRLTLRTTATSACSPVTPVIKLPPALHRCDTIMVWP